MRRLRRPELIGEARRRNREQLAALGGEIRASRDRRRLTQRQLGERVGLSQSGVSALERGLGGSFSLDTWQRIAIALDRDLRVDLGRDPAASPVDAGHLAIQELALGSATRAGWVAVAELPTRPGATWRSGDVALRSGARRSLVLVECVNTITDVGAAARSFDRKLSDLREFAVALGHGQPDAVAGCWIVRSTRANRALLDRYPSLFAARFPGSSLAWLRALSGPAAPPRQPGIVWCDLGATRLFAWRRGASRS